MAGVRRIYGATGLTGGTSGSLDNIDASVLSFGDLAIAQGTDLTPSTFDSHSSEAGADTIYFYRYANVSSAEDVPRIIFPDSENGVSRGPASTGRWLLISPAYFMEDLTINPGQKIVVDEIQGNSTNLTLAYNDGSVYVTIGNNSVTIDAPTTFTDQIISTLPIGTAPFDITSTTVVPNLNVELIGGEPVTNISLLDGTQLYTSIPGVVNDTTNPTITPVNNWDLVTKKWVEDTLVLGAGIDHVTLDKLQFVDEGAGDSIIADDHPQYMREDSTRAFDVTSTFPRVSTVVGEVYAATHLSTKSWVADRITDVTDVYVVKDGSIPFTGKIQGITTIPTDSSTTLVTKGYVDNVSYVSNIDHGSISGRDDDDHIAYAPLAGNRTLNSGFTGVISGQTPTHSTHLSTKSYVDDQILLKATEVHMTKTASIAFVTGVPRVTDVITQAPSLDAHLTTKKYVDDLIGGGGITHDSTTGAAGSVIHTAFPLLTGTRPFTGIQTSNLVPSQIYTDLTDPNGLVTKEWVRTEILAPSGTNIIDHALLQNLNADGHPQYIFTDGTRPFSGQPTYSGVPASDADLVNVLYVTNAIAEQGLSDLPEYVDVFGRHSMLANQPYKPKLTLDRFVDGRDSDLVPKEYVDTYIGKILVSLTDTNPEFYADKVEINNTLIPTTIYNGVDTGVVIDKTEQFYDGITRAVIVDGGTDSFVYNTYNVADGGPWTGANDPQTYPTGVNDLFDTTGTPVVSITETHLYPQGTGTDTDIRIQVVRGDIAYMEVIDAGTGLIDGTYNIIVPGDIPTPSRAEWAFVVSGGVVTSVSQVSPMIPGIGIGYTNIGTYDITQVYAGGTVQIRPYIVGTITDFDVYSFGTGYGTATAGTYNLTELTKGDVEFLGSVTGYGTADLGTMDISFINPKNEKIKYSHYVSDITAVDALTTYDGVGYTRVAGNVISTLTFDKWGHITGITEEGTGGTSWVYHDPDTSATLTAVANTNYWIDTTATATLTVTLPDTPSTGTVIVLDDYKKNSSVKNITVNVAVGDYLAGVLNDTLTIDVDDSKVELTYLTDPADAVYGWRIKVY